MNRSIRNVIHARRKEAAKITDFPVDAMKRLFINENLTQSRKRLFWLGKQSAKRLGYKFIWTNNGDIFVRKNKASDKTHVKKEECIANMYMVRLSVLLKLDLSVLFFFVLL